MKKFHKAPKFAPMPAGNIVLDAVRRARPIAQEAPQGEGIGAPDFTDADRGDAWHLAAIRYADEQAGKHGQMVTTIKTGKVPDDSGAYPATAFLRGGGRLYFSGLPGAKGWMILPRSVPHPQFDSEKGDLSEVPLAPHEMGVL